MMSRRKRFAKNDEQVTDELVRATSHNDARIAITEEKLKVINEQVKDADTPVYKRFAERYLPAELRRIEHMSRQEDIINPLDPNYKAQQLIVHGQIKEVEILIGRMTDIKATQNSLRRHLVDLIREKTKLSNKLFDHRKKVSEK